MLRSRRGSPASRPVHRPLTYFYLPKSARAYLFPQFVKIHYFCSGPISVDPICPQPSVPRDLRARVSRPTPDARLAHRALTIRRCFGPLSFLLLRGLPVSSVTFQTTGTEARNVCARATSTRERSALHLYGDRRRCSARLDSSTPPRSSTECPSPSQWRRTAGSLTIVLVIWGFMYNHLNI